MFTQRAAGRVFDFNREVKLTPAWRSRTMVSVAVGEGDAVYVVNRGTDYHPNLPWNHAMRGNRLSKITVGTEVDDEQFLAQFGTDGGFPRPVHLARCRCPRFPGKRLCDRRMAEPGFYF